MRSNYPISSKELKDRFNFMYERLCTLLGTEMDLGFYDTLDEELIYQFVGCDTDQQVPASGIYNLENTNSPHIFINDINKNNVFRYVLNTNARIPG